MSRLRQLISNATNISIAQITIANFVRAGIGFATSIVIFRFFETTDIANIYILVSVLLISQQIGDLGISASFIYIGSSLYKENDERHLSFYKSVFLLKAAIATLLVLFGFFLSPWLANYLFNKHEFVWWIRGTFVFSGLAILASFFVAVLEVEQRFILSAIFKTVPAIIKLLFIGFIVFLSIESFKNLYLAFMALPLFSFLINFIFGNKKFLAIRFDWVKDLRTLFSFSIWLTISALMGTLFSQVDIIMLKKMAIDFEVARFAGGQKIASLFILISQALFTVLLPKVANYENREQLWRFWVKCMKLGLLLLVPLLFVLIAGPYLVPLLLGKKYEAASVVFQILSIQLCVLTISSTLTLILFNRKKVYILSIISIVQFGLNVILNLFLIPEYGAVGACLSTLILTMVALFAYAWTSYSEIKKMSL